MNKITFYEERSFSEKFNVTFEFLKLNWKLILRYIGYVCLPLGLVGGFVFDSFFDQIMIIDQVSENDTVALIHFFVWYVALLLVVLASSWWVATLMFSLMQVYNERENGLEGITFSELKPYLKHNAWRLFKFGAASTLVGFVWLALCIGLGFVHWSLAVLLVIAGFVLWVPLLLASPVYIYEPIGVWHSLLRSISLGWKTWGGIFALGFVLFLIASVAQSVISMPWQICYFFRMLFVSGTDHTYDFTTSAGFAFISYLASILMFCIQYAVAPIFFVGISYLYSHAAEKFDDMSVAEGIDHFELMADNGKDAESADFDSL